MARSRKEDYFPLPERTEETSTSMLVPVDPSAKEGRLVSLEAKRVLSSLGVAVGRRSEDTQKLV